MSNNGSEEEVDIRFRTFHVIKPFDSSNLITELAKNYGLKRDEITLPGDHEVGQIVAAYINCGPVDENDESRGDYFQVGFSYCSPIDLFYMRQGMVMLPSGELEVVGKAWLIGKARTIAMGRLAAVGERDSVRGCGFTLTKEERLDMKLRAAAIICAQLNTPVPWLRGVVGEQLV